MSGGGCVQGVGNRKENNPTYSRVIATLPIKGKTFERRHLSMGGGKIKKQIKTIHQEKNGVQGKSNWQD